MDKKLGLKIAAVSFIFTSFAVFCVFAGYKSLAFPFVVIGFIGGFVGMVLHYRAMFMK